MARLLFCDQNYREIRPLSAVSAKCILTILELN